MTRRDLNRRVTAFQKQQETDRSKRFDTLEQTAVGLVHEILERTFPLKEDGTPDWDKFDWQRGEQLVSTLNRFQQEQGQPPTPPEESQPSSRRSPRRESDQPAESTTRSRSTPDVDQSATQSQPAQAAPARSTRPAQPEQASGWRRLFTPQRRT